MKVFSGRHVHRGISLIEAIVALAVMAFGLVAVVGLQATLRSNADVSRQRAEAVRLAQEEIERWRAFVSLQADAGKVDFGDIATLSTSFIGTNATYNVDRIVPLLQQAPAPRTLTVRVSWKDRADQDQTVTLNSAIAGISPELAGALVLPQNQGRTWRVNNRNPLIPRVARNFGDGTSGFVPPQGSTEKVVWVFNNVTGVIEKICTTQANVSNETPAEDLLAAIRDSCDATRKAQLLSGFVNFADPSVQPGAREAEAPTGLPLNLDMVLTLTSVGHPTPDYACFDNSPQVAERAARPVAYFCAIYSNPARKWAGRMRVKPLAFLTDGALLWKIGSVDDTLEPIEPPDPAKPSVRAICRYTTLDDNGTPDDRNSAHPLDYRLDGSVAGAALNDQNFLVIRASHSCPTDAASEADPVNSNTRIHQNGISPYD